jgi:5-methylcytosine-specific restriction enzyme subunit McrC
MAIQQAKRLILREYTASTVAVPLNHDQLSGLQQIAPSIRVAPSPTAGSYVLTPDSRIGVVRLGDLTIEIQPKLPIDQTLFLVSYALDPIRWGDLVTEFAPEWHPHDLMAQLFAIRAREALKKGLFHGYRSEEESSPVVKGRILFGERARHSFRSPHLVDVAFDEFTPDVLENRLLRAATRALLQSGVRSPRLAQILRRIEFSLRPAADVVFNRASPPAVHYSRLNTHLEPAVELARTIIRGVGLNLGPGRLSADAFLVDMNKVFEDFVVIALREALHVSAETLRTQAPLTLDEAGKVVVYPDLSWWQRGRCTMVADVKYKRIAAAGIQHPDIYQMLAYTVASGLPHGTIIYAKGEVDEVTHHIRAVGKTIEIATLDLEADPDMLLRQIAQLGTRLEAEATGMSVSAA